MLLEAAEMLWFGKARLGTHEFLSIFNFGWVGLMIDDLKCEEKPKVSRGLGDSACREVRGLDGALQATMVDSSFAHLT